MTTTDRHLAAVASPAHDDLDALLADGTFDTVIAALADIAGELANAQRIAVWLAVTGRAAGVANDEAEAFLIDTVTGVGDRRPFTILGATIGRLRNQLHAAGIADVDAGPLGAVLAHPDDLIGEAADVAVPLLAAAAGHAANLIARADGLDRHAGGVAAAAIAPVLDQLEDWERSVTLAADEDPRIATVLLAGLLSEIDPSPAVVAGLEGFRAALAHVHDTALAEVDVAGVEELIVAGCDTRFVLDHANVLVAGMAVTSLAEHVGWPQTTLALAATALSAAQLYAAANSWETSVGCAFILEFCQPLRRPDAVAA